MTQYALFDPTQPAPQPVTGWYDTDVFNYPNLPPSTNLLVVTGEQWADRLTDPSAWAVPVGVLVAAAVPAPTAAQLAAQAYAAFVAGGLTVTSTATPALSGVYAIDQQSQSDIATEAQFISTFAEFTTGATTNLPWPMPDGSIVVFPTPAQFLSIAKVAGQAVAAAKLAAAQSLPMPAATATIP